MERFYIYIYMVFTTEGLFEVAIEIVAIVAIYIYIYMVFILN